MSRSRSFLNSRRLGRSGQGKQVRRHVGIARGAVALTAVLGTPAIFAATAQAAPDPVVGVVASPNGGGWDVTSAGQVQSFGGASLYGSLSSAPSKPIVGIASTADGKGYWLVGSDGGVFSFGDATFDGSTGALELNKPIVGIASTPDGKGYWLVASDGGVFSFGDARFEGSTGAMKLNKPIVGIASTPDGKGYSLVASDGGVFSFGDATFEGSTGAMNLNKPIVGIASTPDGKGYWLVASDGGVFSFGDAHFEGSLGGQAGTSVAGIGADSNGYVVVTTSGTAVPYLPGGAETPSASAAVSPAAAAPTIFPTPHPVPSPRPITLPTAPTGSSSNPLTGDSFYVLPNNDASRAMASDSNPTDDAALSRIATQSTAVWLGEWNSNNQAVVNQIETDATSKGQVPVFVLYAIPYRDCGSYSSGGYTSDAAYEGFANQVRDGIAGRQAVVIVEPDALPMANSCLNSAQMAERVGLIKYDSDTLSVPGTSVYLDAGNWQTPAYISNMLAEADVSRDAGFSLNVSGANPTGSLQTYGDQISADLAASGIVGKHFVIDTSRNGNGGGGNAPGSWCNLTGLALGASPSAITTDPLQDASLWVKYPGESDGQCRGNGVYDPSAPPSGQFWTAYAVALAEGNS